MIENKRGQTPSASDQSYQASIDQGLTTTRNFQPKLPIRRRNGTNQTPHRHTHTCLPCPLRVPAERKDVCPSNPFDSKCTRKIRGEVVYLGPRDKRWSPNRTTGEIADIKRCRRPDLDVW